MTGEPDAPLVVVGDYAWDVLIRTRSELLQGGDLFGDVELAPGGSAANVAVWAQRCGLPTAFVGKLGHDRFGQLAQEELRSEGVSAHWSFTAEHLTGAVAVWIDHSGERSMVSGKGADHYLLPEELPRQLLERAGHLHLSAWSFFDDPPRAAVREAARTVVASGGTLSLDPGSFQMIDEMGVDRFVGMTADLGVNVLFPNLEEGEILSGRKDPHAIAARLAEVYPGAMVMLKLDDEGAYLFHHGEGTHFPTAARQVVDATGAGDAYAGAFLAAWLRGRSPEVAAARANRLAGWVVARVGARPEADDELRELLGAPD
ncbi:MAG: sugar kinase [Trueperaceae bacterium]